MHTYEIRPRKDGRGFDLISDSLPSERLWYLEVRQAIDYAKHKSRSHDAVIRVYDEAGNMIETHEHAREFKEWERHALNKKPPRSEALWFIVRRLYVLVCSIEQPASSERKRVTVETALR